jgi:hypothetical protein
MNQAMAHPGAYFFETYHGSKQLRLGGFSYVKSSEGANVFIYINVLANV